MMTRFFISSFSGPFIFSDLSLRGFWMTQWNAEHAPSDPKRMSMLSALIQLIEKGQLKTDTVTVEVASQADVVKAVEMAGASHKTSKVLIKFPKQA